MPQSLFVFTVAMQQSDVAVCAAAGDGIKIGHGEAGCIRVRGSNGNEL